VIAAGLLCSVGAASAVLLSKTAVSSTVIEGCQGNLTGLLRVVSNNQTQCLKKLETPVSWNIQGPAGPVGPPGAAGPKGLAGTPGSNGAPGITSVQTLTTGASSACPNGGVRFYVSGGSSYPFCNGANGKDGTNSTVTTTNTVITTVTGPTVTDITTETVTGPTVTDITTVTSPAVTVTVTAPTETDTTTETVTTGCNLHDTGFNTITYSDCVALNTYNETTATEAALAVQAAFIGDGQTAIADYACSGGGDAVELDTDTFVFDWAYDGPAAGRVNIAATSGFSGAGGSCPVPGDPLWH
jgi:hypothetical protein